MGFDIIVRQNGTPILLEVNSSPSLSVEHEKMLMAQEKMDSISGVSPASAPAVRSIVDEVGA